MNRPIGVFDSGVGGLTVAKEIMGKLPNETIYFFGDTENCPYGQKNKKDIIKYTENAVRFLLEQDVKMIVLGCNTATAAALDYLNEKYNVPIIGVIKSGVKAALEKTENNNILVLATNFTVKSGIYNKEFLKENSSLNIYSNACPSFVPFIESGLYEDKDSAKNIVSSELESVITDSFDTVVLACTHYPILQNYIFEYFDGEKQIVSPNSEIITEIKKIFEDNNMFCKKKDLVDKIFTTKYSLEFEKTAKKLLYDKIIIEEVILEDK